MNKSVYEMQEKEAIRRLEILHRKYGLKEYVVDDFKNQGIVYYSEYYNQYNQGILYWANTDDNLIKYINNFEKNYKALVYHIINTNNKTNLLFVSNNINELEEERNKLEEKTKNISCYSIDKEDKDLSISDEARIEGQNGGLVIIF